MTVQTAQTQELSRLETRKETQKRVYSPPADVLEKTDSFAIVAELPGVSASSLTIEVEKSVLSIGERAQIRGRRVIPEW